MKLFLSIAIAFTPFAMAIAKLGENDRSPARNPRPDVASDWTSIREFDRKKRGEPIVREMFVRNHHPSRAIQVFMRIAWVESTRLVEKNIQATVLPGKEKKVFWVTVHPGGDTDPYVSYGADFR